MLLLLPSSSPLNTFREKATVFVQKYPKTKVGSAPSAVSGMTHTYLNQLFFPTIFNRVWVFEKPSNITQTSTLLPKSITHNAAQSKSAALGPL